MAEQLQRMTGAGDEVFLTGASGFVGSHVLHALLAAQISRACAGASRFQATTPT